jgi:ribosomal protein S8E
MKPEAIVCGTVVRSKAAPLPLLLASGAAAHPGQQVVITSGPSQEVVITSGPGQEVVITSVARDLLLGFASGGL